ncbi:hypothetical protein SAMN05421812_104374 [Asanoa hainanensis]|uniref:Uncharacterized protein n=1 Tax=Asanoa hainanensis TaxID=560556 RepID=A0A239LJ79_9ACTN|nr:hypothetical protein [Asanoa hainanensis]SNT30521.1 hypothetical protein SAMN05421812_104374 [Asanoa hainanensis]
MSRVLRAAIAVALAATCVACEAEQRAPLPPALAAELATVVVDAFETDRAAATALLPPYHGPLVCVAEPFGVDPVTATAAADVTTIYTALLCSVREEGVPFAEALGVSSTVAVHRTNPVTVEVPGDGAANQPDRERIFPEDLHERTFEGFRDPPAAQRELATRFAEQSQSQSR